MALLYLDERDIQSFVGDWDGTIGVIERAISVLARGDFAQPIKPYLRYGPPQNRIIAMPAFVGGDVNTAGLKWIASFPDNLRRSLPRAHSVIILNDADSGAPIGILNGGLFSVLRTAGVTGYVVRRWLLARKDERPLCAAVLGWGPIGRHHLSMLRSVLGPRLATALVYDPRTPSTASVAEVAGNVPCRVVPSWQQAYAEADVFVTCTVASDRYIDAPPPKGSLQLNVSLRDYKPETFPWFEGGIVVDDWDEVCRENTDIELFHRERGLTREGTTDLAEVARTGLPVDGRADGVVMFNPMGMAVFDIAVGAHFLARAKEHGLGRELP